MFLLMLLMSPEAAAPHARAPTSSERCRDVSLADEIRVAACTAAINSGTESGAELAKLYAIRGNVRFGKDRFARAIRDYDRSLALKPSWGVFTLRGMAHAKTGAYDLAISDCSRALQMFPELSMAQNCLADAQAAKARHPSSHR